MLGAALSAVTEPGMVVALIGPLGAGKTRLARSMARSLGVPPDAVTSPTFVLIHEYPQGQLPIYHFDAYRIADLDEFAELGPEEYFDGDGICIVEWADRVKDALPPDRIEIEIQVIGENERLFSVAALGEAARRALGKLTLIAESRGWLDR